MFGHHKRKREKRRLKRAQEELSQEKQRLKDEEPERLKQKADFEKSQVKEKSDQAAEDRKKGREEGKAYAEEFLARDVQGLTPEHRKELQYAANKQIQRGMQSANRKLLGEQASHGILGKGGVGYAQQRDLQKVGQEAQSSALRDLNKLDYEAALKNKAAMFNIEQGEAAQKQLDQQIALDELKYEEERKRNRYWEDQMNKLFSRV
jgi:hypothetical protein